MKNLTNNNNSIHFVANFNYVEGIKNKSEVQLAGIKVGEVNQIMFSSEGIIVNGYIDSEYNLSLIHI